MKVLADNPVLATDIYKKNLFLFVAPSGAGKTTVLTEQFERLSTFFDLDLRVSFLETNLDKSKREHKLFSEAFSKKSYFTIAHIENLNKVFISRSILCHFDLHTILRKNIPIMEYKKESFSRQIYIRLKNLGRLPKRSDFDLLNKQKNDYLMKAFLTDEFFSIFDKVVVINFFCDYSLNQERLIKRKGRAKFGYPNKWAEDVHNELYECWLRNIQILKPFHILNLLATRDGFELMNKS